MSSNEWLLYKIGELGKIVTGKTPPTINKENFDGKYPFITPVDMNGQKEIHKTNRTLSETGKQLMKNYLLPANTICVSCIGSDMGKVVKTTKDSFSNQQINSIICNENFDADFVYYALTLLSPELRNIGHQSTAVPIINKSDFSLFEILAPENKEKQSKVAAILSSFDNKIEGNRQTNETLEELAKTLFQEICVPKGNELQGGWKLLKLGNFIELKNGYAFKGMDFIEEGVPVIKIKNVKSGKVILNNLSYVSREIADKTQRFRIKQNDLLITMSGNRIDGTPETWVGKVGIFHRDGEFLLNQRVSILNIIDDKKMSKYFLCQLLSNEEYQYYFISNATSSGGQANISPDLIYNTEIVVPPIEELNKFNNVVKDVYNKIFANELEIETLTSLRDSLLPKLMKGEIII
jgi:type I restriction enzyme S subunit